MKRIMTWMGLLALMTALLTGCGGGKAQEDVDLTAFYTSLEEEYSWNQEGQVVLSDLEGEMLEGAYPGLEALASEQLIAKAPMMSAVAYEIVLVECGSEEDAEKAAAILQERADLQAEGGAWYPATMEAWGQAKVVQHGAYAALFVADGTQEELAEKFDALFA